MQVNHRYWSMVKITIIVMALTWMPVFAQELDQRVLDNATMEIRAKNPKVTDALLAKDQKVIKSAFAPLKARLATKGFNEMDINGAIAAGWKDFRSPLSSLASFNKEIFTNYVTTLGKLKIKSIPDKANIDIDGSRQDEITNTVKWLSPRRHRFTISKDGYFPEEEERNVAEGDNPPLSKTLRPRPR